MRIAECGLRINRGLRSAIRSPQSAMLCAIAFALAQPIPPPPLPQLALDSFSASTREALSPFYKEAIARPSDPAAVGTLARALHAWEQWSAAHEAYARVQALAPADFDWPYLDAVVLQRLARHADAAERLQQAVRIR